jgi:hypothetical protein
MVWTPFLAGQKATALLLNSRIAEELMPWTPLDQLGTFTANGSNGTMIPRMHKIRLLGTVIWELEGRINTTGIGVATTTTVFNFDPAHRVSTERGYTVYAANSDHFGVRLGFLASGALTVSLPSEGTSPGVAWLDDCRITNPQ